MELAQYGNEKAGERLGVEVLPGSSGQRDVPREALSTALARLAGVAGSGVEGALVGGEVEYLLTAVEDILGAVPVVDVPVEDGHLIEPPRAGILCGHGGVVEEAEPHPVVPSGVVTRRAGDGEGRRAFEGTFDRPDGGPGRERRGLPGVLAQGRVEIHVAPAPRGELLKALQVAGRVGRFEDVHRGGLAGPVLHRHAGPLCLLDPGERRREPLRGLHVGHAVYVTSGGGIAVDVQLLRSKSGYRRCRSPRA